MSDRFCFVMAMRILAKGGIDFVAGDSVLTPGSDPGSDPVISRDQLRTNSMSETRLPWILAGISLVIFAVFGLVDSGPAGSLLIVFVLLLAAVIRTVLGIIAAFLTAFIVSTNFGTLGSAAVKLIAISVFPAAVGLVVSLASPPDCSVCGVRPDARHAQVILRTRCLRADRVRCGPVGCEAPIS